MPFAKNIQGIDVYYEQIGEGPDLILMSGLSADHSLWITALPELSQNFRVLIFDNRSAGRSGLSKEPCTVKLMSHDVKILMDRLNIEKANILGYSMGGAILLQLCLDHPERVRNAIICASAAKLPLPTVLHIKTVLECFEEGVSQELVMKISIPWLLSDRFLERLKNIREDKKEILEEGTIPSREGYRQQALMCEQIDLRDKLHLIKTRTLIVAGEEDLVMPVRCSEFLHKEIQGSTFKVIKNVGHMFNVERTTEFVKILQEFLKE